jgi:hypothetical protein
VLSGHQRGEVLGGLGDHRQFRGGQRALTVDDHQQSQEGAAPADWDADASVQLQLVVTGDDPRGRPRGDPLREDVADDPRAGVALEHRTAAYPVLVPVVPARVEQLHVGVVDDHGPLQPSCQVIDQLLDRVDTHSADHRMRFRQSE